jgi:hypothetical protein
MYRGKEMTVVRKKDPPKISIFKGIFGAWDKSFEDIGVDLSKDINIDIGLSKMVELQKPDVQPGETRDAFLARCVPEVMQEGKTQDQAVAQCISMYDQKFQKALLDADDEPFNIVYKFLLHESYLSKSDSEFEDVIVKKGEELRYVLGAVLVPDEFDGQNDNASAEEVRKAAHLFMINFRGQGNRVMHDVIENPAIKIVESYITPVDMTIGGEKIKKGTWMMGSLVFDDTVWKQVKAGELTGFSIGGVSHARKEG